MSETPVTRRLSKVAKELNVGLSTIGDFLSAKGYDIDIKPNTKISNDVYGILLSEFQSEKEVKEESQQLKKNKVVRETVSLEDVEKEEVAEDAPEEQDEVLIKNMGSTVTAKEEAETTEESPAEPEPVAEVKKLKLRR